MSIDPGPSSSKGKQRGPNWPTEGDFEDLNPAITYRHLLSPQLGVKHPLRVVALCDGDAFYAGCERARLNLDWDVPLVVSQWNMVIAVNYPAREYGISRIDKIPDCIKRCPHLKIVHVATYAEGEDVAKYWKNPSIRTHKVSLDLYRRESDKIITMFKEGLPTGEVEKASIDEAFIDFTQPVRERILERFPYLAKLPPDAAKGLDTPLPPPPPITWDGLGNLIPVHPPPRPPKVDPAAEVNKEGSPAPAEPKDEAEEYTLEDVSNELSFSQKFEETSVSDAWVKRETSPALVKLEPKDAHADIKVDEEEQSGKHKEFSFPTAPAELSVEEEPAPTWHDVALSIASEIMSKIRHDIYSKLGYTTTAGIARNKFLAKLAASYRKPFNQNILRNAAIPKFLLPMRFQKIRYLGGKLGKELAKEYDASTVGELQKISLVEMQNRFGECSIWVYEILRGIDRFEVKEKPLVRKSMLASKTLPQPVTKVSEGSHWIRMLAAELSIRLKEARETTPGLWPKTVALHVRQGWDFMRSRQCPFPFTKEISIDLITCAGVNLWNELVGKDGTYYGTAKLRVTGMSLSLCGIDWMEEGQKGIEAFFGAGAGAGSKKHVAAAASDGGAAWDIAVEELDILQGGVDGNAEGIRLSLGSSARLKRRWRSASVASTEYSESSEVIDVDAEATGVATGLKNAEIEAPSSKDEHPHRRPSNGNSFASGTATMSRTSVDGGSGARDRSNARSNGHDRDRYSFVCPRCGKTISLPDHVLTSTRRDGALAVQDHIPEEEEGSVQSALAALRMEHDDFHFAQDLARGDGVSIAVSSSGPGSSRSTGGTERSRSTSMPVSAQPRAPAHSTKKRKTQRDPEGIARYFIKK